MTDQRRVNWTISEAAYERASEMAERYGSLTKVVEIALDRMYREENETMERRIKANQLKQQQPVLVGQTVLVPYPNPQNVKEGIAWTVATTVERNDHRSPDTGEYQWLVRYENGQENRWVDEGCIMGYVV